MNIAVASTAVRSVFRAPTVRNAAARLAFEAKFTRSAFRLPSRTPLAHRVFRCPAESSACLESMQPYHTATASALMTSMIIVSRCGFGWLPEAIQQKYLATSRRPSFAAFVTFHVFACSEDL